jgi:PKD repeat protein
VGALLGRALRPRRPAPVPDRTPGERDLDRLIPERRRRELYGIRLCDRCHGGTRKKGAVFVFSPAGVLVDFWQPWGDNDPNWLYGIGIGPNDHVFVTDHVASTVLEFTAGGDPVDVYGGETGTGPGQFSLPADVSVAADGTCYVSNLMQHEPEEFDDPEGRGYITRFVPGGDWTGWEFHGGWAIMNDLDAHGRLVANTLYRSDLEAIDGVNSDYALYAYEADGTLSATIGSLPRSYFIDPAETHGPDRAFDKTSRRDDADYSPVPGQVFRPMGVVADRSGTVYLTDLMAKTVNAWRPYTAQAGPFSASFAASPQSGTAPLAVRFLDYSNGAVAWSWDFGDGLTSTEHAPAHTYRGPGRYTVSLTTADAVGRSATETRHEYIVATEPAPGPAPGPKASLFANRSEGAAPLVVAFTDESTGDPYAWIWEFGDNATSLEQNPVHTYTVPGTYLVNLTVISPTGTARTRYPERIEVGPDPRAPVTNFTLSRSSGPAPLLVRFTDTSTGSPFSWRWDFGGLAWTTSTNPSVVFRRPGDYAVTLTVTNAFGSSMATKNITVTGTVPRSIRGSPVSVVG